MRCVKQYFDKKFCTGVPFGHMPLSSKQSFVAKGMFFVSPFPFFFPCVFLSSTANEVEMARKKVLNGKILVIFYFFSNWWFRILITQKNNSNTNKRIYNTIMMFVQYPFILIKNYTVLSAERTEITAILYTLLVNYNRWKKRSTA